MVYCGKPSRGCQNCKNRRIKCDETSPSCKNCLRTSRECPGYPEEVDLIFRNHDAIGERRRAKNTKAASRSETSTPKTTPEHGSTEQLEDGTEAPIRQARQRRRRSAGCNKHNASMTRQASPTIMVLPAPAIQSKSLLSIEEQATTFFFETFMPTEQGKETSKGLLDIARPMFGRVKKDSALCLATEAVAMAVFSSWPGRRHLTQVAARLYGRALSATQKAIQNPRHATSDETLLAILLFSIYESITSTLHSSTAWAKHIDGAVAIVKARGVKQLENPQSLLLFRIVRTQMLTSCVHQQKSIDALPNPGGWLRDMRSDSLDAFRLVDHSTALPSVLSAARTLLMGEKTPDTTLKAQDLLQKAEEAQHAFVKWEEYMPEEWAHVTIDSVSHSPDAANVEDMEIWPGPVHAYKNLHISSIRNHNRITQMLYSAVAIEALTWLEPDGYFFDERYFKARDRIQSLVDDICHSVPLHLEDLENSGKVDLGHPERSSAKSIEGHSLIWPLHMASNMQTITDVQKRWLRGRLSTVARRLDDGQAASQESVDIISIGKSSMMDKLNVSREALSSPEDASPPQQLLQELIPPLSQSQQHEAITLAGPGPFTITSLQSINEERSSANDLDRDVDPGTTPPSPPGLQSFDHSASHQTSNHNQLRKAFKFRSASDLLAGISKAIEAPPHEHRYYSRSHKLHATGGPRIEPVISLL